MFFSRSANLVAAIALVTALSLAIAPAIGQNAAATPLFQPLPIKQGGPVRRPDLKGSLHPVPIPVGESPCGLRSDVVFRTLASGGFAGRTDETLLFKDGRMIRSRINLNGTKSEITARRLSLAQVQRFEALVQTRMKPFDRLNYPPHSGSADFITITATSHAATVQYADSVWSELPSSLKIILQAWSRLDSDR